MGKCNSKYKKCCFKKKRIYIDNQNYNKNMIELNTYNNTNDNDHFIHDLLIHKAKLNENILELKKIIKKKNKIIAEYDIIEI